MTNPLPATPDSLAGHSVMQMLDVAMSSIIGDYDDADLAPEWQWVKQRYLFTRTGLTASVLPGWDNLSSRCTP